MLFLRLLGGPSLGGNGSTLTGPATQRHRLALLALLASSRSRTQSRDKLVAWLWPERDVEHARNLLNQSVHALRRAIGEAGIISVQDELRLDPAAVACDVVAFEDAIATGELERAIGLYTGPFLDGFHLPGASEFEHWVDGERDRLRRVYARSLESLADAAEEREEWSRAVERWRGLVAEEPYDARVTLRLMKALERVGDRAGALQQARLHASLLQQEFEAGPDPDVVALADRLRTEPTNGDEAWAHRGTLAAARGATNLVASSADLIAPLDDPPSASPSLGPPTRRGPAESAPAARNPAFRLRTLLAAAGALVAVAALLGLYRGLQRPPDVPLDRNLLAIAPFDVLDPSLQLWREGLGDILTRSLDGAGPLGTVSPSVALRRWEGRADRASAEALGRRTGAGLVVFGTVVPKGRDSVTLRAGVLDAVGGAGQREVEVSGETARIGELADSLGLRILQTLGQTRAMGSVRQVSMASRSLPALKAFLQGEQFYRRGVWDSALARYDQAIAADSTFALAMSRMRRVLDWYPHTAGAYLPPDTYAQRSTLYNHGLSPRESLLIVADSFYFAADAATNPSDYVGFSFRQLGALEEAVRRYPGDPEAWYVLGETRMHSPFPIGSQPATVAEAFSRAIALDSGFAPAYQHMADLAIRLGRPELGRQFAAAYLRLYPNAERALSTRLVLLALDPTQSAAVDTARLVDSASVSDIWHAVFDVFSFFTDSAESQVRLLRKIGDPNRSPGAHADWVLDSLMWPQYLAVALAYRGHLREAYQADRRLLLDPAASKWSGAWSPFLDLALLGVVPDSMAGPVFARALEPTAAWGSWWTPRHLRGLPWWLARGDTASLTRFAARAAEETRRPNPPEVVLRARLLGATATAYAALVRGDSARALEQLEAIPDTLCLVGLPSDCFHLNLTLARLLAARGEDRRAGALLERWRWATVPGASPWFVLATLERGRVAERLGEREKAIDSYRLVTDAWRRADPELQPYVTEAQRALARLARAEQSARSGRSIAGP